MNLNHTFLLRFLVWSARTFYLFRTALVPRNSVQLSKFDRSLRFLGAIVTSWLGVIALGRTLGLLY
jgi:hypothetical protein